MKKYDIEKKVSLLSEESKTETYAACAAIYLLLWHNQTQGDLAKAIGIHKPSVSQLLSGKRKWPSWYIDKASSLWGLEPDEFLAIGRQVRGRERIMPYVAEVRGLPFHSEERLTRIFKLAAKGNNALQASVSASLLKNLVPKAYEYYLGSKITDGEMYHALVEVVKAMEKDPDTKCHILWDQIYPR